MYAIRSYYAVPVALRNISGKDIGYVLTPPPDRLVYETGIRAEFGRWQNLTGFAALLLILLLIGRMFVNHRGHRSSVVYLIGCTWIVRYAMVYARITSYNVCYTKLLRKGPSR